MVYVSYKYNTTPDKSELTNEVGCFIITEQKHDEKLSKKDLKERVKRTFGANGIVKKRTIFE